MATLEKIRNKAGLLIIVVGAALFAFIIGDFLNSGSTYFRQTQEEIASIDGEVISIQDYQKRIDEMSEIYKMQSGNTNLEESIMTQIRQTTFQTIVREIILGNATQKLGITVSPEELFDMVQGENISPMLTQQPMFQNEAGVFDKTNLLNFLKAIDEDNIATYPAEQRGQLMQMRSFWLFWEKAIKTQKLEEKYSGLITKTISTNVLDAKDRFEGSSVNSDVDYVMQSFSSIPDSLVTINKSEIEKLYNQRKESFKQNEAKVINYISVDIVPSEEDFNKAKTEIESIKQEYTESNNIIDLVNEYSEVAFVNAYFSKSTLPKEDMKAFVENAEIGDVEGPLFSGNLYNMYKLVDKTVAPDSVKISQIMLAGQNETELSTLTDSLLTVLKTEDFAEVAKKHSMDQLAQIGGELGWITEANAIQWLDEEYKDLVFNAPVNSIQVYKNMYGTFLVKVTEKTAPVEKYKLANIQMAVTPSSKTYSDIYNQLNQYVSNNNTLAKFKKNAQEAGFDLSENVTVNKNDQLVSVVNNSRQVVRWAFQHKGGAISDIFECDNTFLVAAVEGTIPEGYRSLASVTPQLEGELRNEKKGAMIVEQLKAKNLTSLDAYATEMNDSKRTVKFVEFNTPRITDIGMEPKLNAMIALMPVGELSKPVAGNNGVYVFEVTSKNGSEKEYDEKEQIAESNLSYRQKGNQAMQELVNNTDIEDNRVRFY